MQQNLRKLKQIENKLISLSKFKLLSFSPLKNCNFLCSFCTQPVSDLDHSKPLCGKICSTYAELAGHAYKFSKKKHKLCVSGFSLFAARFDGVKLNNNTLRK